MFASTILLSILLSVVLASPPELSSIENEITEYAAISFSRVSTGFEPIGQVSIADGSDNNVWILPGAQSNGLYQFNLDSNSVVGHAGYSTPFEEIAAGRYSLDGVTTSNQMVKFFNGQSSLVQGPAIKYVSNDVMNNQEQIYGISVDGNTIYKFTGSSWVTFQRSHTFGPARQVAVSQGSVWILDENDYLLQYKLDGECIAYYVRIKYIDASQENDLWALHENNVLYQLQSPNGWSGHIPQGLPTPIAIDQIEAGANYIVVVSEKKLFKAPRQDFKDEEMVVIAGQPIMKVTNAYWMAMVVIVVAMAAVIALVWQCGGNKKEYQVIEDEITPLV